MKLKDLKGKDLSNFSVTEMTEIFKVNEEGKTVESRGFLKNSKLAETLAEKQPDPEMWRTRKGLVITNGYKGLIIAESSDARLLDEEAVKKEVKERIIETLSPTERKILGIDAEG